MQSLSGQDAVLSKEAPSAVGWHCVIDLHDCESPYLDDTDWVRQAMLVAASRAEATIVGERFHRFEPQGISGVVIIGESHLAIHVWPERCFAAVDVFTCNASLKTQAAAEYLIEAFEAKRPRTTWLARGEGAADRLAGEAGNTSPVGPGNLADPLRSGPANDLYIDHEGDEGGHWFIRRRAIVSAQTPFQKVDIVELSHFGKALILDGDVQSVEADEYIYHEALVQPAMCLHPLPRNVLIVGGGEGAVAREVLKHETVERVVMVDIDAELVSLAREHLQSWHRGSFEDGRVELQVGDGREFVLSTDERFDVVIVDVVSSFDGGPAESLYTTEFYEAAKCRLRPGGVLVVQGMECQAGGLQHHARVRENLERHFGIVRSYQMFIPSFWSAWGFVFASDRVDPLGPTAADIDKAVFERGLATTLRFYDGRTHAGIFALPKNVRELLGEI